jgi:hypothetical protein
MSHSEIEQLKKYIDGKLDPFLEQHDEMYTAFTTVRQGGTWLTTGLKYFLYVAGSLVALYLAFRDIFKSH